MRYKRKEGNIEYNSYANGIHEMLLFTSETSMQLEHKTHEKSVQRTTRFVIGMITAATCMFAHTQTNVTADSD